MTAFWRPRSLVSFALTQLLTTLATTVNAQTANAGQEAPGAANQSGIEVTGVTNVPTADHDDTSVSAMTQRPLDSAMRAPSSQDSPSFG